MNPFKSSVFGPFQQREEMGEFEGQEFVGFVDIVRESHGVGAQREGLASEREGCQRGVVGELEEDVYEQRRKLILHIYCVQIYFKKKNGFRFVARKGKLRKVVNERVAGETDGDSD